MRPLANPDDAHVRPRARRGAWLLCLAVLVAVVAGEPGVAVAATTSTAPYAHAGSDATCDLGAVCTLQATADPASGRAVVDLSAIGTATSVPRYCPQMWPPDPTCALPGLRPAGATGRAWVEAVQALSQPARAVAFTVIVRTDEASARSSTGRAAAYLWAAASPAEPGACTCGGSVAEVVVSSDGQPTAAAGTRSLTFSYTNSTGGTVPAGRMTIAVGVSAEAGGPGSSSVRLPVTVTSVTGTAA